MSYKPPQTPPLSRFLPHHPAPTVHLLLSSVYAKSTFANYWLGWNSISVIALSISLTFLPSSVGDGANIFPDEPQSAGKVPDERLRLLSALPWLRRGASHLHSSSIQWRLHTQTRSPASWGVFSDAPMSEGDDHTHGCSPCATIFYDYAFPLSTNKTDDNDLFLTAQPLITLLLSLLIISQRTTDTWNLRGGENLNVPAKLDSRNRGVRSAPDVGVFDCFQLVGRALSLTLERQQKTSSCYRPDVAPWLATLLTRRTGILIGPVKTDPSLLNVASRERHSESNNQLGTFTLLSWLIKV